jgi:hypothetical protein
MKDLSEMLREKRRLEAVALAADSAVLRQSLAIWERYGTYIAAEPMEKVDQPMTINEAILCSLNGESLSSPEIISNITEKFPHVRKTRIAVHNALARMSNLCEIKREGAPMKYRYTKRI